MPDELERLTGPRSRHRGARSPSPTRADLDVLEHGQVGERADALERPGEAGGRAAMRAPVGDVDAGELDPSRRSAAWKPLIALTSVVLPAPLGPISPRIVARPQV